jgi:hypothetical protein
LLSIAAWVVFALVHQAPQFFEVFPSAKEYAGLHRTAQIVSWIPPKTGDVVYLAAKWAKAGTSSDLVPQSVAESGTQADRERLERGRRVEEEELLKLSPIHSIGSSLLFEAVILLFAMWRFSRTDF